MDGLIEWCEDLDFEKYMDNWNVLDTSAKSEFIQDGYNSPVVELGAIAFNPKATNASGSV